MSLPDQTTNSKTQYWISTIFLYQSDFLDKKQIAVNHLKFKMNQVKSGQQGAKYAKNAHF